MVVVRDAVEIVGDIRKIGVGDIRKIGCVVCGKEFVNACSIDMFCSDACEKRWTAIWEAFLDA